LDIQTIVAELKGELTRIGEVIGLLEGNAPAGKRVGRPPASAPAKARTERRGRGLTPAGRRKLSEAMKRRWAQRRGPASASKATANAKKAIPKKRGGMSAEGRRRISEAMKKRWAEKNRKAS
jgi:hypothetical protein